MSNMSTAPANSQLLHTVQDYVSLTKPRVTSLVIATAVAGIYLAPGHISVLSSLVMLAATVLVVASANVLNCWLERDSDGLMDRTRSRALPAGRLSERGALIFGVALAAVSVPLLTWAVNPMTGIIGALALTSYVGIYTPMKSMSAGALLVGAIPGALPPLMGWTAVTGRVQWGGIAVFGIVFLWQLPHVIGLGSFRRDDYAAAGIRVLPAVVSERMSKLWAVVSACVLVVGSFAPVWLGMGGTLYIATALLFGGWLVAATLRGYSAQDNLAVWGRRVFLTTLAYLPALLLALVFDSAH